MRSPRPPLVAVVQAQPGDHAAARAEPGPFTTLNAALAAVHSAYELAGGIGMPGQKVFGLSGTAGLHPAVTCYWAGRGSRRSPPLVALLNGMGLAGAVSHYIAWPARWRSGLPALVDRAEGLSPAWTRWYNLLLYAWVAAATLAVARETPPEARGWAAAGLASIPLVALASHGKHRWVRQEAHLNPRWWNRALQPGRSR